MRFPTNMVSIDTDSPSYFKFDKNCEFSLYGSEQAEGTYHINSTNIKINTNNSENSTIKIIILSNEKI